MRADPFHRELGGNQPLGDGLGRFFDDPKGCGMRRVSSIRPASTIAEIGRTGEMDEHPALIKQGDEIYPYIVLVV
ncbi:MAG: hypothetical protein ACN4E6_18745 [Qipengyuania pacifica]